MIRNDEALMTNDEGSPNAQMTKERAGTFFRHSDFVIPSSFVIFLIMTSAEIWQSSIEFLEKLRPRFERLKALAQADITSSK
jgi:hypothetical protein